MNCKNEPARERNERDRGRELELFFVRQIQVPASILEDYVRNVK